MARPRVVVTRRLPDAVEARLSDEFEATLNPEDAPLPRARLVGRCAKRTGCSAPSPTPSMPGFSRRRGGGRGSSPISGWG